MNFHNDFDANVTTFYKVLRDRAGYHTMVTGRDDLDKSSGGPGPDGMKHTDKLGFSDSVRCDGSTDVTCNGQPNCQPHEPYGVWLKSQPIKDPAVAAKYNCTDLFELKAKRFAELHKVSLPGNSYAIDHPQPLNGTICKRCDSLLSFLAPFGASARSPLRYKSCWPRPIPLPWLILLVRALFVSGCFWRAASQTKTTGSANKPWRC